MLFSQIFFGSVHFVSQLSDLVSGVDFLELTQAVAMSRSEQAPIIVSDETNDVANVGLLVERQWRDRCIGVCSRRPCSDLHYHSVSI